MMKTLTNRSFVREYSHWRKQLAEGRIGELEIPQSSGLVLHVTVKQKTTPVQRLLQKLNRKSFKNLQRPKGDIF